MAAEIVSPVHLVTELPDGVELRTEIGSITVDVHPDGIDLDQARLMLAALLTEAGSYLLARGDLTGRPAPSRGEGESGSLD
ncbi:hypothetical protein ACFYQA_02375 [Streptomyces sp. NPDC005774]|uniref:hypothetical protein n=1 Tax=Streptomyces sp. NPDC005774 TaxID=3364728 RepID=UPI0036958F9A